MGELTLTLAVVLVLRPQLDAAPHAHTPMYQGVVYGCSTALCNALGHRNFDGPDIPLAGDPAILAHREVGRGGGVTAWCVRHSAWHSVATNVFITEGLSPEDILLPALVACILPEGTSFPQFVPSRRATMSS